MASTKDEDVGCLAYDPAIFLKIIYLPTQKDQLKAMHTTVKKIEGIINLINMKNNAMLRYLEGVTMPWIY